MFLQNFNSSSVLVRCRNEVLFDSIWKAKSVNICYEVCLVKVNIKADWSSMLKIIYYYSLKRKEEPRSPWRFNWHETISAKGVKEWVHFEWEAWEKLAICFYSFISPSSIQNVDKLHTSAVTQGKESESTMRDVLNGERIPWAVVKGDSFPFTSPGGPTLHLPVTERRVDCETKSSGNPSL